MPRSIVICCDGTGNTSSRSVSNVYRMIELLALDHPDSQAVVYDQGIGTPRRGLRKAQALAAQPETRALTVLPAPVRPVIERVLRPVEMAFGIGLYSNVRQTYQALAELYDEGDVVYLFGFSRGAFTVRALAGLIHRCGLPARAMARSTPLFADAWCRFTPIQVDWISVNDWRKTHGQRECPIHFMGLWDTVKSYGGLRPIVLPHLRHNPRVKTVRHAIALDEKRGWFNVTTWGRLDLDRAGAMTRLQEWELEAIERQDIDEVWFRGCHSDIGGGDEEEATAQITRHWMLNEAVPHGLSVNAAGATFLRRRDFSPPVIHESLSRGWSLVDLVPRLEIDNSGEWPRRRRQKPGEYHAIRHPESMLRNGKVRVHRSAHAPSAAPAAEWVDTRTPGGLSRA